MKFGIVGYGSIGRRHAANLRKLKQNVLVYDPMSTKDVKFERNIYETCDAVIVCTPTPFHEGCVRAAVERGKHVLVEKPISINVGALPEILASAKEKNLVVMMGNNLRFHPCVKQAKAFIENGHIGTPLWSTFICAQKNDKYPLTDAIVLNWGAHEVDVAMHLFGPVAEVLCVSHRQLRTGIADSDINAAAMNLGDMIDFTLRHESGVRSSFHLDYITPNEIRESWIAGYDTNIGMEMLSRTINLGKWTQQLGGSYDDDYLDEMKAFIDAIEGKPLIGASGEDGLATLRVLLDVQKKANLA
jgi:predicted dehydrogenase